MKCRVCRAVPVIELRQHNAAFCERHFLRFCRDQVERTIAKFSMFTLDERVLVAVSGGKDSLALWDILQTLGYSTEGLVIGLGIGEYSDASSAAAARFASDNNLVLRRHDLETEHGFTVPTAADVTRRVPCSACGLSKRHIFDRVARTGGFDVVVTGHNLDDEAAVLFGNVARWQMEYLARQSPLLSEGNGFPRKAKPLIRLGEREMAAYCVLRGIDYIVEECPMSAGNKHLHYKTLLNELEQKSPGAKQQFYFGFLERAADRFSPTPESGSVDLTTCSVCGAASSNTICSFCNLVARAAPVHLSSRKDPAFE